MSRKIMMLVAAATVLAIGYASYWYYKGSACDGITAYSPSRDRAFLLKVFKDNWHWLIPEGLDFSAEEFLTERKTKPTGISQDQTLIYVYCVQGKPVGFVSFYQENFYKGKLRMIAIDSAYRGKGYSEELMNFAMDSMRKMGLHVVQLMTRVDNIPAIKLYERMHFNEYARNDKFVFFEKSLDAARTSIQEAKQRGAIA